MCGLVAAVSAVVVRRAGARAALGEFVWFAAPLAVLAVVVVAGAVRFADALLLWAALPVLSAGPWAWVVLWRHGRISRPRRLVAALVAVVILAVVAFFVGGILPPVLLLTAVVSWAAARAFPGAASAVLVPVVLVAAVFAGIVVSVGSATVFGQPTFPAVAVAVPVAMVLALCVPWRVGTSRVLPVTVALLAAAAVDVVFVLPGTASGADFDLRTLAGTAFGHLGVLLVAAMPDRGPVAADGDDPPVSPTVRDGERQAG